MTNNSTETLNQFNDWSEELNRFSAFMTDETDDDDFIYQAVLATYYVIVEIPQVKELHDEKEIADAQQFLDHNRGNVDAVLAKLTSDGWFEVALCECCGDPSLVPAMPAWLFQEDDE